MRKVYGFFTWIRHPQLLVGFVALCLCVSALSGVVRSAKILSAYGSAVISPKTHVAAAAAVDCNTKPCLALTFDDGPNPITTPQVLDILARERVKATFFVIGMHVPGKEAIVQREFHEGHEIGDHSWSHSDMTKLSPEGVTAQIQMTQNVIAAAGVPAPKILRPPYGAVNNMVASRTNLTIVRWNADPEDWLSQNPAKIQTQVLSQARPGAIVIMHDIYPATVAALTPILDTLKQHYQLVTVSQLLDIAPGDQGQFFARYK